MKFKNPFSKQKFYRKTINDLPGFVLEILLYLACFFPFVELIYIGSDTQPYGALVSLVIVVVYWFRSMKTPWKSYTITALICVILASFMIVGFFQINPYMVIRSYYTYFSLMIIPLAVFLMMKRHGGMNETFVKVCIWIWFLVGMMQKYVNPEFGYSILSRHTTNANRGVVSLASEPSAYGYVCLFMMLLAVGLKKYAKFYELLLLIQIVAFAGSSVTLVYLAVYVGCYIINEILRGKKFAFLKVTVLAGGGYLGLLLIREFASGIPRMHALVNYLFTDPAKILKDESIVMRVDSITYSFQSFWENHLLPHGLSEQKLMSGTGILFYECGFIAVFLLTAIGAIIWKAYPKELRLFYLLGFLIVMFSSIPYSSPIVCFYLGYLVYEGWSRSRKKAEFAGEATEKPVVWYSGRLFLSQRRFPFL